MIATGPSRPAALPAAVGATTVVCAALSRVSVPGVHQVAGIGLIVLLAWSVHRVLTRLSPGLEPVPAVVLSGVAALALLAVLIVVASAATMPVRPVAVVILIAVATAALAGLASVVPASGQRGLWQVIRGMGLPAGFLGMVAIFVAAIAVLAVDIGATTARVSPSPAPERFTALSFAGSAARWNAPVAASPGAQLTVPLTLVNRSAQAVRFQLSSDLGTTHTDLTAVQLVSGRTWTGQVAVRLPLTGCPNRLAISATSPGSNDAVDVWLDWPQPACR